MRINQISRQMTVLDVISSRRGVECDQDTEEDGADPAQTADENDSEAEAYELQDEMQACDDQQNQGAEDAIDQPQADGPSPAHVGPARDVGPAPDVLMPDAAPEGHDNEGASQRKDCLGEDQVKLCSLYFLFVLTNRLVSI